jgi:DNA polymerase-3 subunit delta'
MLFKDVIGHQHIKEKLISSLKAGRVSHAQLFLGQNGTGPLPMALAYAQYVNCANPQPDDSCGVCDSCRKMMSLEYPDLHFSFPVVPRKSGSKPVSNDYLPEWRKMLKENPYMVYSEWMDAIEAENRQGNITAEECREIIKKLSLKPMYEGHMIMIIWMPEQLGKEGNILLKTLEEPSENTLIILVGENEELVLPTILSRTQLLRIPRISDPDLSVALQDKLNISPEDAGRLVAMSDGNYNTALRLYSAEENNYTEEFISWMRLCFKPDMGGVLKWVEKMATTGRENQKNFLLYGLNLFRQCLLQREGLPQLTKVLDSEKDFIRGFANFVGPANIQELSEAFSTAHYHIERNANPKILLFNLSLLVNELLQRYKQRA